MMPYLEPTAMPLIWAFHWFQRAIGAVTIQLKQGGLSQSVIRCTCRFVKITKCLLLLYNDMYTVTTQPPKDQLMCFSVLRDPLSILNSDYSILITRNAAIC